MKNLLLHTLGVLALALMPAAQASAKYCYPQATYDRDGDGYAHLPDGVASTGPWFQMSVDGINCPHGYASKAGDCDDANANVHPRHPEVAFNQVDDNCNGEVDEPSFWYLPFRHLGRYSWNTPSSFTMYLFPNHMYVRDTRTAALYADITYRKLADVGTRNLTTIQKQHVERTLEPTSGERLLTLTVTGLSPGTVYTANVQFYRRSDDGQYTAVGPHTDDYYTMTDSTNEKVHKRYLIVLKGLDQFNESELGRKGYRGTDDPDGTRYGADRNEKWCSEFYAWVTQDVLDGIEGSSDGVDIRQFFRAHDSWMADAASIPEWAMPGDYLALDTDQNGDINHTAMFLAYNPVTGKVRTLEGNHGNAVAIVGRDADWSQPQPVMRGLGHIARSMLD